ncbi:MAG: Zn-ribbon domain-containing OB-fold protein [Myxococcales bacterium]|nr:MAG: Zn-ribbon domain-containing OB-fold protein [Myxococcales bacterium]
MAIKEKITQTTHLSYYEGKIPISYRYTYGLAGELFFRKLKEGKLIASVAQQSGVIYCPPRIFCEDSFEEITDYVELDGAGVVESFTISCEDMHGDEQEPTLIAFVRFDGADGGFAAPLRAEASAVYIGMEVKLAFAPKAQRKGSITDVYFVPLAR